MRKSIRFLVLLAFASNAFGHGGGEAEIEIGPDKGVTEVTKDKSFKLSPEAHKNFELKTLAVSTSTVAVPKEAIVHTLKQAQIFRVRDGFLKPIPFRLQNKTDRIWTIQSNELRVGDEIITTGVGFLRMIAAQLGKEEEEESEEEAAAHGHGAEKEGEHKAETKEDGHAHGEGEERHD